VIVKNAQYSVHGSTEISSEGFHDSLSTHHLVTASNGVSSAGPDPETASCLLVCHESPVIDRPGQQRVTKVE
jgi:hypothetical protein